MVGWRLLSDGSFATQRTQRNALINLYVIAYDGGFADYNSVPWSIKGMADSSRDVYQCRFIMGISDSSLGSIEYCNHKVREPTSTPP